MRSSNLGTASIALSKYVLGMVYCGAGPYIGFVKRVRILPAPLIRTEKNVKYWWEDGAAWL